MANLGKENVVKEFCDWIGISIHMETLGLLPQINMKLDGILYSLNMNLSTKKAVIWMKKKLKSFLMNNISHYFRRTTNTTDFANETMNKLYITAAYKYMYCCITFKEYFKDINTGEKVDIQICKIIYSVIRSLFKYLVYNVREPIYDR